MDIYSAQVVFNRGHNFDRIDLTNSPSVSVNELQQRLKARLPAALKWHGEMKGQELENAVTRCGWHDDHQLYRVAGGRIHHLQLVHDCGESAVEGDRDSARRRGGAGNINAMFLGEALLMGVIGSARGLFLDIL